MTVSLPLMTFLQILSFYDGMKGCFPGKISAVLPLCVMKQLGICMTGETVGVR